MVDVLLDVLKDVQLDVHSGCPFALGSCPTYIITGWGIAGELLRVRVGESVGELLY